MDLRLKKVMRYHQKGRSFRNPFMFPKRLNKFNLDVRYLGGGFKYVFNVYPIWGNDPIWLTCFTWVVQPPTRYGSNAFHEHLWNCRSSWNPNGGVCCLQNIGQGETTFGAKKELYTPKQDKVTLRNYMVVNKGNPLKVSILYPTGSMYGIFTYIYHILHILPLKTTKFKCR